MNRSFIDILNEQLTKQEPNSSFEEATQQPVAMNIEDYETPLVQSLRYKLNSFHFRPQNKYSFRKEAPTQRPENCSSSNINIENVEIGYFPISQEILEARLFLGQWNEKLPNEITKKQLKRLYRKMALKLHPDTTGGDANAFLQLKSYFEILEASWIALPKEAA